MSTTPTRPVKTLFEILEFATRDNLMAIISQGRDPHKATAAFAYGITEDEVTAELRHYGKTWNFSAIYSVDGAGFRRLVEATAKRSSTGAPVPG